MDVVAVQDVAVINFIAVSKSSKEALKSANLLKSLKLNTLISGETGTGRRTLAKVIAPDAPIVKGNDPRLYTFVENSSQLIIDNIEKVELVSKLFQAVQKYETHIIAIGTDNNIGVEYQSFFSVSIVLPPLRDRVEDIKPLAEKFLDEASQLFGWSLPDNFNLDLDHLDISQNAFSLRRSVYLQSLAMQIDFNDILNLNESYLLRRMEVEKDDIYKNELLLYEVPLIRAGMKKYRSQLKMSQAFGLNRNTLRKKINVWMEFIDGYRSIFISRTGFSGSRYG